MLKVNTVLVSEAMKKLNERKEALESPVGLSSGIYDLGTKKRNKKVATNITADKEPLICQKCGTTNWISRKPFSRREKKVRMMKLDDVVWTKLRRFKAGFPDTNAALAYIIHKVENLEEEYQDLDDASDRFKDIIVQEVKE